MRTLGPLALKNTDSKSVASTVSAAIRSAVRSQAHLAQRGFMAQHNLADNVMEMAAYSRFSATTAPAGGTPALFLDLEAAFPSVSRPYLFESLVAMFLSARFCHDRTGALCSERVVEKGPSGQDIVSGDTHGRPGVSSIRRASCDRDGQRVRGLITRAPARRAHSVLD